MDWTPVAANIKQPVQLFCPWCGRAMVIPKNTALPIALKCAVCMKVFVLCSETRLDGGKQ